MKSFIAFAVFIVGISALPKLQQIDLQNERLITDSIASAIQDVSQQIKDAGLDPLYIESESGNPALPVPVIFSAEGLIEELLVKGLSNIVINNMNFAVLTTRLTFDIELPLIEATLQKADVGVVLFGEEYSASASGRLAINRIRVIGNVRVAIGIISGISVRSISMNFSLASIESAMNVVVQNWDLSNSLNTFLGATIPNTLNTFSAEINELIEIIAKDVIEANL